MITNILVGRAGGSLEADSISPGTNYPFTHSCCNLGL